MPKLLRVLLYCLISLHFVEAQTKVNPTQINFVARFSSPPVAPVTNTPYMFVDASGVGVCSGGGTSYAWCVWNGSAYVVAGGFAVGLGDPGSNSIPYRNGPGTSIPAVAANFPTLNQDTTGNAATATALANPPYLDVRQFNFAPVSPGGSLTGGSPATITIAGCKGIAGTDQNHYLYVSGTGTAEDVLITGGTGCTITFTPANNHSAGWTIQSATAGGQEALNVAIGAAAYRHILFPAAAYTVYAPINGNGNSNIWVELDQSAHVSMAFPVGSAFTASTVNPWSDLVIGNGYFFVNSGSKGATTNVTSNVNYPVVNRAVQTSPVVTIPLASVSGLSVGTYVFMQYQGWGSNAGTPEAQQEFSEVSQVTNISGSNVTFQDNIVIPLATAAVVGPPGNNQSPVYPFTPILNNWVTGGVLDGTTGVANSAIVGGVGLFYAVDSGTRGMTLQNMNNGALTFGKGYRVSATDTRTTNCPGYSDVWFIGVTYPSMINLTSIKPNFGPALWWVSFAKVSNVNSTFSQGRGMKIMGSADGNFSGVYIANAVKTGFSVEGGSFNNHFVGITAVGNGTSATANNWGIYTTGEGNVNNTWSDVIGWGNNTGNADILLGALDGFSDDNQIFKNLSVGNLNSAPIQSVGDRLDFNDAQLAVNASSGSASINSQYGIVTTDSLTTTTGNLYALVIDDPRCLSAKTAIKITVIFGSANQGIPVLGAITAASGSFQVVLYNLGASAFNGTFKIAFELTPMT